MMKEHTIWLDCSSSWLLPRRGGTLMRLSCHCDSSMFIKYLSKWSYHSRNYWHKTFLWPGTPEIINESFSSAVIGKISEEKKRKKKNYKYKEVPLSSTSGRDGDVDVAELWKYSIQMNNRIQAFGSKFFLFYILLIRVLRVRLPSPLQLV